MITPYIDYNETLNNFTSQMECVEKRILRYRFVITALDAKIRETACLIVEVATCQLKIIEDLLNTPANQRNFSAATEKLKEKVEIVKSEYLENYASHLRARDAYVKENGSSILLTEEKRKKLQDKFLRIMNETISSHFQKNPKIDETANLKYTKQHFEELIRENQEVYNQLFDEKTTLQEKEQENIMPEYKALFQQRENIRRNFVVTDIYSASQIGNVDFIQKAIKSLGFFERKATLLNTLNEHGFAPLHYAAYNAQSNVLDFLLKQDADPSIKDRFGYQPLHWAAKKGDPKSIRSLLEHGADINSRGAYGRTPLHMAVFNGNVDTARLLLDKGADINAQTTEEDSRKTPLHDAVIHGDQKMVEALLEYEQINVQIQDICILKRTPLDHALQHGLNEIAATIQKHASHK